MTDEVRSVSSTGAEKGVKLAAFDLIPSGPLHKLAEHYGIGAKKYSAHNWRAGYEWSKSYAAMMRHLNAFWGGEDIDEETGSPHLAAAAFHCFAILEWMETHPEFDDRYKDHLTQPTDKGVNVSEDRWKLATSMVVGAPDWDKMTQVANAAAYLGNRG